MKLEIILRENNWLSRGVMDFGWGNGYVKLPKEHKFYGLDYDEINNYVDVHCGLTYSQQEDEYWVVGFDTAHSMDSLSNWSKEAVEAETIRLKEQLENCE